MKALKDNPDFALFLQLVKERLADRAEQTLRSEYGNQARLLRVQGECFAYTQVSGLIDVLIEVGGIKEHGSNS